MEARAKPSLGYRFSQSILPHLVLFSYVLVAMFPIVLIVMNSFKSRKSIFDAPLALPFGENFSLVGYETIIERANFDSYFANSLIVTVVSILLILLTGSMAAYALSEYRFPGNTFMGLYLALGIMIPIRLGTVGILRLVISLNLVNTPLALILVYVAMGLPLTIFVLQQFMRHWRRCWPTWTWSISARPPTGTTSKCWPRPRPACMWFAKSRWPERYRRPKR
jgi:raffinose/stachyose/melibiose transport system permease protein